MLASGEVVALAAIARLVAGLARGKTVTRASEARAQSGGARGLKPRSGVLEYAGCSGEARRRQQHTQKRLWWRSGEGGRKGKRRTVELTRDPGGKTEVVECPGGTGGLESGKWKIGKMTPVQVQRGARQICFAWAPF